MMNFRIFKNQRFKKLLKLARNIILGFLISSIIVTLAFRFINPPITPLMIIRVFQQIGTKEGVRLKKDWVSYDELPEYIPLAIVSAEDQKFTEHSGFDIESIKSAYKSNKKGKKKRGGSTISQQTAKNVFLWPKRSWIRKGLETWFCLLTELFWSKKRILEVYLNVAEMGNGIYGIEEASLFYFNKSSTKITKHQAALIAAILPNPRKWNPKKPTSYLYNRQNWILSQMQNLEKLEID